MTARAAARLRPARRQRPAITAPHQYDGQCDTGDTDDDNDQRPDTADTCPLGVTGWVSNSTTDVDLDGCRDVGEDCNACAATCGTSCTDTDVDGQADCLEQYCGSDPAVIGSTCVMVATESAMNTAVTAANGSATTRDFDLISASYTVAGDPVNISGRTPSRSAPARVRSSR